MTEGEALARANACLAGVDGGARDARKLLAWVTGRMMPDPDAPLPPDAHERLERAVAERAAGRPVSRIVGSRAFWKHDFGVTDAVLDPRPDTETLVEQALAGHYSSVLDLGTGSGCILVSLLAEWPQARGTGTDISPAALEVARRNAEEAGVAGRAAFILSDWFGAVDGRFDLIVSNPPYIAEAEMPGLAPEVRLHDPPLALCPGGDGLGAYRAIAAGAGTHLAPGGRLLVEIGAGQGEAVRGLFAGAGLREVRIHADLDGRDRVVAARAPSM